MLLALTLLSLTFASAVSSPLWIQQAPQPAKPPDAPGPPIVDVAGYQKALAEHRGKPVLVNFWATWCPPCRTEYPELVAVAREFQPQGLAVFGVSMDDDAEINLVRRFIQRNKPGFQNYRMKMGLHVEFAQSVHPGWRGSLPATFLYDAEGRLVGHLKGAQSRAQFEAAARLLVERHKSSSQAKPAAAPSRGKP